MVSQHEVDFMDMKVEVLEKGDLSDEIKMGQRTD